MSKFHERLLVPCLIIVVCTLLWGPLDELPEPRFEPMGAALFPKILLGSLVFLTILDIILGCYEERAAARRAPAEGGEERKQGAAPPSGGVETPPASITLPIFAISGFIAYLLLITCTDISYIALTFVYITLASWHLGHFAKKALLLSLLTSGIVTGIIYVVFGIFMETIFP